MPTQIAIPSIVVIPEDQPKTVPVEYSEEFFEAAAHSTSIEIGKGDNFTFFVHERKRWKEDLESGEIDREIQDAVTRLEPMKGRPLDDLTPPKFPDTE